MPRSEAIDLRAAWRRLAPWLVLAALLGVQGAVPRAQDPLAHPMNRACDGCHISVDVTPASASKLVAAEERLCGDCHVAALQVSHPSGFRPNRELPDSLPVDWKGDLTCSTCHDVHAESPGRRRVNQSGKRFCLMCHDEGFFAGMRDQGVSLLHSGHLDADDTFDRSALDLFSIQCLGCHDAEGGDGAGPMVRLGAGGVVRHGSNSANHPIDVDYAVAARYGGYRAPELIDPAVLLPGGRVSCVSCHEGYASSHGRIVQTRRSLCTECHDL